MLYGSSYVATALALRMFTPLGTGALRGVLGGLLLGSLLLLPAAARHWPRGLTTGAVLRLATLGALAGPIFVIAMNTAVALAGSTVTAFVAGLYAVLAAALAIPLLGERLTWGTVAWLLLALAGTALLGDLRPSQNLAAGIAVALGAAIAFALFLVLARRWSDRYRLPGATISLVALAEMGSGLGVVTVWIGDPGTTGPARAEAVAAVAWLAIGPGALAAILVVTGMRRLPARRASTFLLLNPPTAALGGWVVLGERLSAAQMAGAVVVLVAIAGAGGLFAARSAPG
jgi:probable blue pigment (indigoidine) exporter